MAKNIQVNLTFTADTNAAKQQMNLLLQLLSNLAATPINATPGTKMSLSLQQATLKAVELKVALNNATNVDTGKLNFSKFSLELKRNKTSLLDYAMLLKKLGPEGVLAFSQLANAIRLSETPLISLLGKAAALGKTLANTARWMISSSMLLGVMSAFSGTIDYAKELNESLTSIRVVTGKSAEDMSKFAKEANKAAKALGATTTEYTDASLIYYQLGLSDKEVKARTETTIKLANVVGEQASTVSEWMTAIWNNFDDGSLSLEHYADVLAKLGAATASSADEIAGGIEKFAAVADTIDLSYEYAAAALATITAETRQSEDVVGTSLKTIFARIENLKLGETLEDGTTLGQYSEALAKVGVHIQDANGNLRGMDNILNDIGARWDTLGKSEQVALAQSVAGIRQYNQFMALMSNWDVMEENVQMAKDANGELEHQHEIWETGLEGATKRVLANLEEIKNSLLDENDLIPLLNIADGFLTVVGDLIDSLGGLPGLLSIIASIGLKIYGPLAASMLMNMTDGIRSLYGGLTGKTDKEKSKMIVEASKSEQSMTEGTPGIGNTELGTRNELLRQEVDITTLIESKRNDLNNSAKEYLHILQETFEYHKKNALEAAKEVDKTDLAASHAEERLAAIKNKTFKTTKTVDKDGTMRIIEDVESTPDFDLDSVSDDLIKRGTALGMADSFEAYNYSPGESANILADAKALAMTGADPVGKSNEAYQNINKAITGNADGYKDSEKASQEDKDVNVERRKGLLQLEKDEAKYLELKKKGNKLNKEELQTYDKLLKSEKARSKAIKLNTSEIKANLKALANNVRTNNDATKIIEEQANGNKEVVAVMEDVVKTHLDHQKAVGDSNKAMNSAKTTAEGMQGVLKDNASYQKTWADTFVSTMQGVASAAAGLLMITGAFDSLTTSIADGSATFSDYLTALTSVAFAIPMLLDGLSKTTKFLKLDTLWSTISAKAKKTLADEDSKATSKMIANSTLKIGATIKEAMTNVANWFTKGPLGWIIAGVGLAALAAIGISMVNAKKANAQYEEDLAEDIETGKKAIEVGEGWKEQSDSMDDLIENHKRLQATSANTVESLKEILEAQLAIVDLIPSLVDKYQELIDTYNTEENKDFTSEMLNHINNIEAYSKAWEKADADRKDYYMNLIEEETNAADILANKQVSKDAWKGAEAAAKKTLDTLAKLTKDEVGANNITWHVGDKTWGGSGGKYADELASALGITASSSNWFGGGVDISLDASKPEEFIALYEKLLKYVEDTRSKGNTKGNDVYREVREGLEASKEAYEELKELYGGAQDFRLSELLNEQGIDPSTINSYNEYIALELKLIKLAEEKGIATAEEAKQYLKAQKTLSSYALLEQRVASFRDNNNTAAANAIQNYAKGLKTEEDLEIFLSINFDDFLTETAFDGMMDYLRSRAKSDKLKLEFESSLDAYDDLKSNMSMEDYEKFQEALTWGEEGLLNYSLFLEMEFSSQLKYLADLTVANATKTLNELEIGLKELIETSKTVAGKELEEVNEEIELQRIRIALIKKGQKEAEDAILKEAEEREKLLDSLREEIDLYFKLNNLKKHSEILSEQVARAKDRAYGKAKLKLMELERKALENEIKLNEKTIQQNKEEQALNKTELEQRAKSLGVTVQYDAYGNIDNYTEMLRYYNLLIADEELKGETTRLRQLLNDKKYFEDYVQAYQENLGTVLDLEEDNAEKTLAIWDSKLEDLEYELEIKTKVDDRQLAKLERQLKRLDDDGYDSAERVAVYLSLANELLQKFNNNKDTIRSTLLANGVSDADIAAYMSGDASAISKYKIDEKSMEILETSTDNMIEAYETLEDIQKSIQEEFMTGFNAFHDEISAIGDDLSSQMSIIDNYKNIVDLMGKEQLGLSSDDIKAMEKLSNEAAQAKVQNAKANMDLTRNTLETVRKNMETAEGEELEYWEKREQELNRLLQSDVENLTSLWGEAIQTAYDTFGAETLRAIDEFSDALAGANFDSMDELQKAYEREVELSDRYVENYKQAYELSKLNRLINQNLDKTDNIKSQKMLREVQKEIEDIQKSGKQLTDYELNALLKKYDLRLAEIALEDAQNAKSTVRLRRDSEGNFGYVYTANEVEIDKALQNYEDKLYALQELNDNYLEQLQSNIISNRTAMLEELRALDMADIKDKAKYEKEKSAIIKKYTDNENFMLGEMLKVFKENENVRNNDLLNYGNYQLSHLQKTSDWTTSFNNTTLAMETGYLNIETFLLNLNDAIGDPNTGEGLLGSFDKAYDSLEQNLKLTFEQAGVSLTTFGNVNSSIVGEGGTAQIAFTSFKNHIAGVMYGDGGTASNPNDDSVAGAIKNAKEATVNLRDEADKALNDKTEGLAAKVKAFYDEYKTPMQNAKSDAEKLDDALTNLMHNYTLTLSLPDATEITTLAEAIDKLSQALRDLKFETNVVDNNTTQPPPSGSSSGSGDQRISFYNKRGTDNNNPNADYTTSDGTIYHLNPNDNLYYKTFTDGFVREGDTVSWDAGTIGYTLESIKQADLKNLLETLHKETIAAIEKMYPKGSTAEIVHNGKGNSMSKPFYDANWNEYTYEAPSSNYADVIVLEYKFVGNELYAKVDDAPNSLWGEPDAGFKFKSLGVMHSGSGNAWVPVWYLDFNNDSKADFSGNLQMGTYGPAKLIGMDTGGYTGSWGPEGRLAMLHQKEIVLNAHDTENLLTAVSMIREISDKLESNALAMRYLSAIGNYNAAINTNNHETLQQEVTIHAEFPNATNHSEIEEAFGNLVNLASQYANRK